MPPSRHMGFPHFFQIGPLDWPKSISRNKRLLNCSIKKRPKSHCYWALKYISCGLCHFHFQTSECTNLVLQLQFQVFSNLKKPILFTVRKFHSNPKSFKQESFRISIIYSDKCFAQKWANKGYLAFLYVVLCGSVS